MNALRDGTGVRSDVWRTLITYSVKIAPPGGPLFELRSGEKSRFYIDVRQTAMRAAMHIPLGRLLYENLKSFPNAEGVRAVAGVALGGCHLASITAMYSHMVDGLGALDVLHVRKEAKTHGLKKLVEGPWTTKETRRVILVEDVVTTGGSSLDAVKALSEEGYETVGILAVVDRRVAPTTTLGEAAVPLKSLFTLKDFE